MLREFYQQAEGKAIPYNMELTDLGGPLIGSGAGYYGAYNPYVPNAGVLPYGRVRTPMQQREAFVHSQVYGGTEPVDWLMDAIDFVVTSASSSAFHFEDDQGNKSVLKKGPRDPEDIKVADYGLAQLFKKPNPQQDWMEFMELTLMDYLLVGNAYWVKWKGSPKKPGALYRMPPQFVRIVPDQFGPAKYLYKLPMMQNEMEFMPNRVLHFRRPNPHSPYFGVGLIKGGARVVDMELALTNTAASYYENAAMPTGVVESDRRVPRDVFNKLKSQIASFYSGAPNAGRLMVLEAGLKFSSVSPTAANALFVQMGSWSRDRILAMFHINKVLLGMYDEGQGAPAADDWQRLFDQKTMIPLLNKFGSALSQGLTQPGWGVDIAFDYEETMALADVINRANMLAKLPGVKVHEVRSAAKLPPSTGDPKVDDMVLNMPGPNMDENGQGGFPDRNLPGEAGRPPLPENTRPISAGLSSTGPAGGNHVVVPSNKKAVSLEHVQALAEAMSARAAEVKAMAPAHVTIGNRISSQILPKDTLHSQRTSQVDMIVADTKRAIEDAIHDLERGLLDTAEGKAEGTMYQRIKNSPAWASFRKRLTDILESAAQRGISLANRQHATAGFNPADVDYEALASAQVGRKDGVLSIVKTVKDATLADILSLQRHGSNPGEFTKAILKAMESARNNAERTALTEACLAYNEGTIQVADSAGMNVLVSDGEEDDEPCVEANGQVWSTAYAREHSLEHPRCRRAFVPTSEPATTS